MAKIKSSPFHLAFIAIFPVISLYAHNIDQTNFINVIRALVVFLLFGLFIGACFFIVIRSLQRAVLIASYGLIAFYIIIPLQSSLLDLGMKDIARIRYLGPLISIVLITGIWRLIKKVQNVEYATSFANLFSVFALILPLFQIGTHFASLISARYSMIPSLQANTQLLHGDAEKYPDIYLIVLDNHGRTDEIKKELGYDNANILSQLTDMGFYLAPYSHANYPSATWQSMYVTLNMNFFDNQRMAELPPRQAQIEGFYGIKNNQVLQYLKGKNYQFVNFNTMYDFLNFTDADYYYDFTYFPNSRIKLPNKFESLLLKETLFGALVEKYGLSASANRIHYDNVTRILGKLPQIPQEVPSPKFVYVHLIVPHFPFVFLANGDYRSEDQDEFSAQKYIDQVIYIDTQIVGIARDILNNSDVPPIIIIQGDHGFSSPNILNAYYFPNADDYQFLYPTISPVNTFRLIFSLYFDDEMELLPDLIYYDNLGSDREHFQTNTPYIFSLDVSNDK